MSTRTKELFPWSTALARFIWPGGRARRKRWVVAAAVILLLVAAHTLWVAIASSRLVRATERVAGRWGSMAPGSMAPPIVPDAENAAKPVRAAGEMLSMPERVIGARPGATVREFGSYVWPEPTPAELESMRRAVRDNALTLRILDAAVERPAANWNLRYSRGIHAALPNLRQLIDLAKLNVAAGRLALRDGNDEEVIRALLRGAALDRSLANEPILLIQMTRSAIDRYHLALLREWLRSGRAREPHVERIAQALADAQIDLPMQEAIIGEAKAMVEAALESTGLSMAPWRSHGGGGVLVGAMVWLIRPVIIDNVRAYLELMDRIAECAGLPRYGRPAHCGADVDPERLGGYHFIARTMLLNPSAILARADMAVSRRRLALLALALERHRLERGEYPESLEALAPPAGETAGEASILIDPLTGATFAYETAGSGYTLASRGMEAVMRPIQPLLDSGSRSDPVLEWRIRR